MDAEFPTCNTLHMANTWEVIHLRATFKNRDEVSTNKVSLFDKQFQSEKFNSLPNWLSRCKLCCVLTCRHHWDSQTWHGLQKLVISVCKGCITCSPGGMRHQKAESFGTVLPNFQFKCWKPAQRHSSPTGSPPQVKPIFLCMCAILYTKNCPKKTVKQIHAVLRADSEVAQQSCAKCFFFFQNKAWLDLNEWILTLKSFAQQCVTKTNETRPAAEIHFPGCSLCGASKQLSNLSIMFLTPVGVSPSQELQDRKRYWRQGQWCQFSQLPPSFLQCSTFGLSALVSLLASCSCRHKSVLLLSFQSLWI